MADWRLTRGQGSGSCGCWHSGHLTQEIKHSAGAAKIIERRVLAELQPTVQMEFAAVRMTLRTKSGWDSIGTWLLSTS